MRIYTPALHGLRLGEVRRYAGLKQREGDSEQGAAPSLPDAMVADAVDEALALAEPRAVWDIYNCDCAARTVGGLPVLGGQQIVRHIGEAGQVVILAATVGAAIECAVSRCFDAGRCAYAVLLDAAATAAVEQVADSLEDVLRDQFGKSGQAMKWRFSPGYGDWPLDAQPLMLRLSHADTIGVSLTESLMLTPRKSITALIPLVAAASGGAPRPSCGNCRRGGCEFRS